MFFIRAETVFGLPTLNTDSDELILVEDETDAMAIFQATRKNVLAISRLKGMMLPQQVCDKPDVRCSREHVFGFGAL